MGCDSREAFLSDAVLLEEASENLGHLLCVSEGEKELGDCCHPHEGFVNQKVESFDREDCEGRDELGVPSSNK